MENKTIYTWCLRVLLPIKHILLANIPSPSLSSWCLFHVVFFCIIIVMVIEKKKAVVIDLCFKLAAFIVSILKEIYYDTGPDRKLTTCTPWIYD